VQHYRGKREGGAIESQKKTPCEEREGKKKKKKKAILKYGRPNEEGRPQNTNQLLQAVFTGKGAQASGEAGRIAL